MYAPQSNCSSVFKSGENQTTPQQVTAAWIRLVNKLEQSKGLGITGG